MGLLWGLAGALHPSGPGHLEFGSPPAPTSHEVTGTVPSSLCTFSSPPRSPEGTGMGPEKACLPGRGAYRPNLLPRSKWVQMVGGSYRAEF